ncbi:glyoxalase [Rhodohalobacter sp. SW132]|uniref:VOC family protein n=1 Tax=Rhodohalobacter sp. SW132 TaxID=2293433 RepID=UPI000E25CEB5|nr:VOC family protein [Rhodohalobacter sp. SW132]REL24025.1 glyoxalase [Rhodohalobacter sp. SW132]
MIKQTLQITILVKNLEEAKRFYTQQLNFEVHTELEFSDDWKYLTVTPDKSNETVIELCESKTPEQHNLIGNQGGGQVLLMFESDDIEKDYQEMKIRGVEFNGVPKEVPGGNGVGFKDLYGNQFDLFQPDNTN